MNRFRCYVGAVKRTLTQVKASTTVSVGVAQMRQLVHEDQVLRVGLACPHSVQASRRDRRVAAIGVVAAIAGELRHHDRRRLVAGLKLAVVERQLLFGAQVVRAALVCNELDQPPHEHGAMPDRAMMVKGNADNRGPARSFTSPRR